MSEIQQTDRPHFKFNFYFFTHVKAGYSGSVPLIKSLSKNEKAISENSLSDKAKKTQTDQTISGNRQARCI